MIHTFKTEDDLMDFAPGLVSAAFQFVEMIDDNFEWQFDSAFFSTTPQEDYNLLFKSYKSLDEYYEMSIHAKKNGNKYEFKITSHTCE